MKPEKLHGTTSGPADFDILLTLAPDRLPRLSDSLCRQASACARKQPPPTLTNTSPPRHDLHMGSLPSSDMAAGIYVGRSKGLGTVMAMARWRGDAEDDGNDPMYKSWHGRRGAGPRSKSECRRRGARCPKQSLSAVEISQKRVEISQKPSQMNQARRDLPEALTLTDESSAYVVSFWGASMDP